MDNVIGYIHTKENKIQSFFKKVYNILFFKIKLNKIDENRVEILINRAKLKKRETNKLKKKILENKINILVLSNQIKDFNIEMLNHKNIKILNGKELMRFMILDILKYICKCKKIDIRLEEIYITINNDNLKDIILEIADEFKSINIVTDEIKKLKRLDKRLDKIEECLYSISNNNKKSLKKAKIIVNFDYGSDFFDKFNYNKNSIIINASENKLKLKKSYNGTFIENMRLENENDLVSLNDFNNNIIYESYIYGKKFNEAKELLNEKNLKIKYLIGINGEIPVSEFKANN